MSSSTNQQKTALIVMIVIAALAIIALAVVVFFVLLGNRAPTPAPTQPPPTATSLPSATASPIATQAPQPLDPVWDRIQQQGKMIVGISADYPPFSYVDPNFVITGFDLALIQEIGRRLDIPLDIRDMAFDGVLNALQVNQVDVVIAALSITPERDRYVDFSNIYFVSQDAVLAKADSTITIGQVPDLAKYRVSVQRGSVYESWLRDTLIEPGLMPPQNLVAFSTPEEAVDALQGANPRVQLAIIDSLPAEVAERAKPVKIVARNLNPQMLAIAIPQGAVVLQSKINQELGRMQSDGTLGRLAKEHLNVDNLIPPPTPAPTQPPATPETCLDGMKFVEDLNYPDYNMTSPPQFPPNTSFKKGWRMRNTGSCTWDNTYVLNYVGSNPPNSPVGGNPVAIQGAVKPGETYDIYVDLVSPAQPGRYQSFWQLRNAQSLYFGDRLYAGFDVVGQVTPTPPPAPVIYTFNAKPKAIAEGESVTIKWQFEGPGPLLARLFRNNELILIDLPYKGEYLEFPPITGTVEYLLVVDSQVSGSARAMQYVTVVPVAQPTPTPQPTEEPPVILSFNADMRGIELGQCVNLSWLFTGTSLVDAQLLRAGEVIAFDLQTSGSYKDCPPAAGEIEYTLRVSSEFAGTVQQSLFVTVLNPETGLWLSPDFHLASAIAWLRSIFL